MEYKIKNNFFAMGKLYKAGTIQDLDELVVERNKQNIVAINKVAEKRVKKNGTN
jgi:uncharacterized Zn finger protein